MYKRVKGFIKRRFKKLIGKIENKTGSKRQKEIKELIRTLYTDKNRENKESNKAIADDMLSCTKSYGISPKEYILNGFELLPVDERPNFAKELMEYKACKRYPAFNNANYEMFLEKKAAMALKFSRFYGREIRPFYDDDDRGVFKAFVKRHPVFTYIPSGRPGPLNHKIIDIDKTTGVDDIFDILIAGGCFVAAEPTAEDDESVIKAVTFINDCGDAEIIKISSCGSDAIPDRDDAEKLLKDLALVIPELRLVEWEIAYSGEEWVLVDGSARPVSLDASEVPAASEPYAAKKAAKAHQNVNDGRKERMQKGGETVINFTGDFSFSGKFDKGYLEPDVIDPNLVDFLNDGDAAVINFESTLTEFRDARAGKTGTKKRVLHRSDPEALEYIKSTFKNPILSFGNNHQNDFSDIGIIDTADNTEKSGIRFIGLGRCEEEAFRYEIIGDDIKVGIFSVMYRLFNRRDDKEFIGPAHEEMFDQIQRTINEIRSLADYVVIIYHGGLEFSKLPDPDKRTLVKRYLEMGCDAVVSHHPHVVQGYEYIGVKPVFYSLGNFCFDTEYQRAQDGTDKGLLLRLIFSADGINFETVPLKIDRERCKVLSGEQSDNFFDISAIDYETEWSKSKSSIENIEKRKNDNVDDEAGELYLNETILIDRAIEKIRINNNAVYFRDIHLQLLDKKKTIRKNKEKRGVGLKRDEHYMAIAIGRETGQTTEAAEKRLDKVCKYTGLDPVTYYVNGLCRLSDTSAIKQAEKNMEKEKRKNTIIKRICKASGMTPEEVLFEAGSRKMPLEDYYFYGLYGSEGDEAAEIEAKISTINELRKRIKKETYGRLEINDKTKKDIAEIYEIAGSAISKERMAELIGKKVLESGGSEAEEMAVDMHLMHQIWGFRPVEYRMFAFRDKPIEERLTFVSTSLKNDVLNVISPQEASDVLNNKYLTYKRVGDLYGREMVLYDGDNFSELLKFVAERDAFVMKAPYDAMGTGVSLVKLPETPDAKRKELSDLVKNRSAETGEFLAEELIEAHETISRLNPDSVNTVRICTYNNNGMFMTHDAFAKIGRAGSFVDNGGAGGIFVHIDAQTGRMDSDGIDEKCNRYTEHPDNGLIFRDYAFPEWEKALETAVEAAKKIPEMRYIGWDLTYTKNERWIIVEGNARTQFLGQQATTGKGTLESFAELLGGAEKLHSYYKE